MISDSLYIKVMLLTTYKLESSVYYQTQFSKLLGLYMSSYGIVTVVII